MTWLYSEATWVGEACGPSTRNSGFPAGSRIYRNTKDQNDDEKTASSAGVDRDLCLLPCPLPPHRSVPFFRTGRKHCCCCQWLPSSSATWLTSCAARQSMTTTATTETTIRMGEKTKKTNK